jgi:hypothetical protein
MDDLTAPDNPKSSPHPPPQGSANGAPGTDLSVPQIFEPRRTSELFSDAVDIMRKHLKVMVLIALPFCTVELLVREYATILMRSLQTAVQNEFTTFAQIFSLLVGPFIGAIMLLVFSRAIQQVLGGVLIHKTHQVSGAGRADLESTEFNPLAATKSVPESTSSRIQRSPDSQHSVASTILEVKHLIPRLIITDMIFGSFLFLAILIVPIALLIVAAFLQNETVIVLVGVFSLVYMVIAFFVIWLRWALYSQAIVIEGKGPFASLRRSAQLMGPEGVSFLKSPKLRLSVLLLLYWGIAIPLQSVFFVPLSFLGTLAGQPWYDPPPLTDVSMAWAIPIAGVQIITSTFLFPIVAILFTHFYYEMRVRYEGWGLIQSPGNSQS